jgi:hypothetical protein
MRGEGPIADQIRQMVHVCRLRYRITNDFKELSAAAFRRMSPGQLEMF